MKVESKLLIKVAFAIILVCGVEMKRVKSTKTSGGENHFEIIKNAVTFCKIGEPESQDVTGYLLRLGFNSKMNPFDYLIKLTNINENTKLSDDDKIKLFVELSEEQKENLFEHLREKDENKVFKTIKEYEDRLQKKIASYLKEKTCLNLKNKIFGNKSKLKFRRK